MVNVALYKLSVGVAAAAVRVIGDATHMSDITLSIIHKSLFPEEN